MKRHVVRDIPPVCGPNSGTSIVEARTGSTDIGVERPYLLQLLAVMEHVAAEIDDLEASLGAKMEELHEKRALIMVEVSEMKGDGSGAAEKSDVLERSTLVDMEILRHLAKQNLSCIYPPVLPRPKQDIIQTNVADDDLGHNHDTTDKSVAEYTNESYVSVDSEDMMDEFVPGSEV